MPTSISALDNEVTELADDDLLVVDDVSAGATGKVSVATLRAATSGGAVALIGDPSTAAPGQADELQMRDTGGTLRTVSLKQFVQGFGSLDAAAPDSGAVVPLVIAGVARRATPAEVVTAARGARGTLVYEWTGGTGDLGPTRTARDTSGTVAGTLAVTAEASRVLPGESVLRLAISGLRGLVAREVAAGTLPDRVIVSFRYVDGDASGVGYSGLFVGLGRITDGVITGAVGARIPAHSGNANVLCDAVGTTSGHAQIETAAQVVTSMGSAPDGTAFDQGGYRIEVEFSRPKGTAPAAWEMRVRVEPPSGGAGANYVGAGAVSGVALTFAGKLDGLTLDTLLIGAINDSWSPQTVAYELTDLRVTRG